MLTRRSLGWLAALLVAGGAFLPPFSRGLLRTATFLAALAVLTVLRELGRLVLGRAMGLRSTIVEIGEGTTLFRRRLGELIWHFKGAPITSATIWVPPAGESGLRVRLALLAAVRPAVSLAVVLGVRALGVPLVGDAQGGWALQAVAAASVVLLTVGLFPFTIKGATLIPFESDGLALLRIPFAKPAELAQSFARYYLATAFEALKDGDPAGALAACEEGVRRYGPPWSEGFRNLEALARGRMGDVRGALAQAERNLAPDLPPLMRAGALNNWSWYAFLGRNEGDLRLAERRSADAMTLQPGMASIAGTRGAILLWKGRVAEALPLLERGRVEAADQSGRDINACLVAIAHAARGESSRAEGVLAGVERPEQTEGLWAEAQGRVRSATESAQILRASRGRRSLVVKGDAVELLEGTRIAKRLASSEIDGLWVGVSARGRAQLVLRHEGRAWRLPLEAADLGWARMLMGGAVTIAPARSGAAAGAGGGGPGEAEVRAQVQAQERAYREHTAGQRLTVSSPKGVLLLASGVTFAASMLMYTSWKFLALLMPVLFFHELGHWLAMRAFGHRDARISFIPFLGAATFSKTPFEKRWQEIVMLLAGPVPGIVVGAALLLPPVSRAMHSTSVGAMMIVINVANLLPLHPLDGGRIMHALVTAGRPRLDLALRTIAALAFLAGGLAARDPILSLLGVLGVVFWRNAYRTTMLEARIRRMPGFAPRLPPEERRDFIFRALAEQPARGSDWATTVAGLETSLVHGRPPLWQTLLWAGSFAACIVGGGLFAMRTYRTLHNITKRRACPPRETAQPISCGGAPASAAVDWRTVQAKKVADKVAGDETLPVAAFVWCSPADPARTHDLVDRLKEAQAGAPYCASLPWEPPVVGAEADASASAATRRKARWTLAKLRSASFFYGSALGLKRFDRLVDTLGKSEDFDPEVARLMRQAILRDAKPTADATDPLAARLGRSPTDSCKRLVIHNVTRPSPEVDGSAPALSFAVRLATTGELDDLARYLCDSGCRLQVLPADPDDPRLAFCF